MTNFETFGLPAALNACLTRMNYTAATPIQAQSIPAAMQGRDILGSAQTGTGKTAAFCIPLVNHLMNDPKACALVMTPTRELATQVMTVAQQLAGRESNIRTALLIGGDSMVKQFKQLNNRPRIIIGTPGRINDHLRRNRAMLEQTNFIVLDEADRMLDMGFTVQIDEVLKFLPQERQTLMFSATMPQKIAEFSKRYMKDPVRVAVAHQQATADNITHEIKRISSIEEKYTALSAELTARDGSIIIFVKTKRNADRMATRLQKDSFHAEAIHGDLKQSKRDRVIADFRAKKHRILVATDVASRGLDVPHVEHVINYDLPQVAEDYIHRIGRTARAGAKGNAMCFLLPSDNSMWSEINGILNPGEKQEGQHQFQPRRKPGQRLERNRGRSRDQFKPRDRDDNRSGAPRQDGEKRSYGEKRAYGEKRSYGEGRPQGEKRFSGEKRPFNGKKRFDRDERPQGEKKPFQNKAVSYHDARREDGGADETRFNNEHHSGEQRRSKGEYGPEGQKRQYGEKREGGQKRFYNEGKPRGEKRFNRDERPQGEKRFNRDERPQGERRPHGDARPQGEKRFNNDRPRDGEKRFNNAERPQGEKRFNRDERPQGEKRFHDNKKPGGSANPYRRSKNHNNGPNKNSNPDKGLFRAA